MPKYSYRCTLCEAILEVFHSMSETREECEKCGNQSSLQKMPSNFSLVSNIKEDKKTGALVKESIEEFRQDLEEEKRKLKNEFYRSDE